MKASALFAAALLLAAPAFADGTTSHPLTSLDNTTAHEVVAETTRYMGRDAIKVVVHPDHKSIEQGGCDNCTFLNLDDVMLSNGTIELEVASTIPDGAPDWARGFVGIVFRTDLSAKKWEGIYLRPANATEKTQIQRNHTVQYFSYPDHPWHALRKETPGHYEAWAPITLGEWTKMTIDVDGTNATLYLNGSKQPSLIVTDLKLGADAKGGIGLFTEPATEAYFRNLVVTHR